MGHIVLLVNVVRVAMKSNFRSSGPPHISTWVHQRSVGPRLNGSDNAAQPLHGGVRHSVQGKPDWQRVQTTSKQSISSNKDREDKS